MDACLRQKPAIYHGNGLGYWVGDREGKTRLANGVELQYERFVSLAAKEFLSETEHRAYNLEGFFPLDGSPNYIYWPKTYA